MDMETYGILTSSPTPPLPTRRRPPGLLPPPTDPELTPSLIPAPLFSKRKRLPSRILHVTVHDLSALPSPTHSISNAPSSPSTSFHSSTFSANSSPSSSAPSSPSNRPRALTYSRPEPDVAYWDSVMQWRPHVGRMPRRCLRRKPSPKEESLRSLRVKDSEACLQRVYDERLEAYLNGDVFHELGGLVEE